MEERFLPALQGHVSRLSLSFPGVRLKASSWSAGSKTDLQGFEVGIDCVLRDARSDRPDSVALVVSVMHITTGPLLQSADVVWGHPSGAIEAELSDLRGLPYTHEIADSVQERLPILVEALELALERGGPPASN
jgi:hypothetical protein